MDINAIDGDIGRLRDELLAMCDKLREGDIVRSLQYTIEKLSKSAIEQIREQTRINKMLSADLQELQLGTAEETMVVKTEPASLSMMESDSSTGAIGICRFILSS